MGHRKIPDSGKCISALTKLRLKEKGFGKGDNHRVGIMASVRNDNFNGFIITLDVTLERNPELYYLPDSP